MVVGFVTTAAIGQVVAMVALFAIEATYCGAYSGAKIWGQHILHNTGEGCVIIFCLQGVVYSESDHTGIFKKNKIFITKSFKIVQVVDLTVKKRFKNNFFKPNTRTGVH
jgi:hypothetical protein